MIKYCSKGADFWMLTFSAMCLIILSGSLWSLWNGDVYRAVCRLAALVLMVGITTICHEAWKIK